MKNAKQSKKAWNVFNNAYYFCTSCPNFSLKAWKFMEEIEKMVFWEKCTFVKNCNFSRKTVKFCPIWQKFTILAFLYHPFHGPYYFSDFSIIGTVLVKLWPKKYKNQLILDPKFPNKSKKNWPSSVDHILGTVDYFATWFAALKLQWKILSFEIKSLFWPWTPVTLIALKLR